MVCIVTVYVENKFFVHTFLNQMHASQMLVHNWFIAWCWYAYVCMSVPDDINMNGFYMTGWTS